MQRTARKHQSVELLTACRHRAEVIGHGNVVGDLTQCDQGLHARHGEENDQRTHYDRQIEGTRCMHTVVESGTHHEDRVDIDAAPGRESLPEMKDPAYDHCDGQKHQCPFLPPQQERLPDQKRRTDTVGHQQHQVRRLEPLIRLLPFVQIFRITHRFSPCSSVRNPLP